MDSLAHDRYIELLFDPNTFHVGGPGNDFGDLGVRFYDLGVDLGDLGVHFGDLGAAMVILGCPGHSIWSILGSAWLHFWSLQVPWV